MQPTQQYKEISEEKLVYTHSFLEVEEVSNYKEAYQKFFKSCVKNIVQQKKDINLQYLRLQKSGIRVNHQIFSPFSFTILNYSPNFEVVQIKIQWGFYSLQAHILNVVGESLFHSCNFECGSNAKVYHVHNSTGIFSVKCIKITASKSQATARLKRKALQEYFIFRIASALECGPFITKYFGFDLLMTDECIEFALQNCKKIDILTAQVAERLKSSLYILHRMNIVHFDIKPENLMWSNHFKHEVMIDFGLSQIFKGEYGYKYLTTFKGSPNYCLPQMAYLIFREHQNYVDIYYNDVYCLNQSIKNFRNHLFSKSVDSISNEILQIVGNNNTNDQSQENYSRYEQSWNISQINELGIMHAKFYIYSKNKEKIQQIFTRQCQRSIDFSGEILNFIKNNCDEYYLKQIYLQYIPDSIKDSVQNGWISRWAKSTYPKAAMLSQKDMSQNKNFFLQIFKSLKQLSVEQNYNFEDIGKNELDSLLFVQKIADYQVYFYIFVKYASFINNYHKIKVSQKLNCCKYFVKIMMLQVEVTSADQLVVQEEIILAYLCKIYIFILNYYVSGHTNTKTSLLGREKKLQLFINIIQHIFFFSLLTTQQSIHFLKKVYELKFWSQLQRLQFIITIININDWNLVPLFGYNSISVIQIKQWYSLRYLQLGKQRLNSQCQIAYDQFKRLQARQNFNLTDDHYILFKSLPSSLKQQIWLTQLPKQLAKDSQYPITRIRQFLALNLSHVEKGKILPIYFHFFVLFLINYNNLQESLAICEIFKKNLLSDYFYQKLINLKILKGSSKQSFQQKVTNVIHFAKIATLENIGFVIIMLSRELTDLVKFLRKNTQIYLNYSNDLSSLRQELQNACKRIDFHLELAHLNRQCENKQYIYYYFTIKSKIHEIFRIPFDNLSQQIIELQQVIQHLKCEKCRKNMLSQLIRQYHERIMFADRTNAAEKLIALLNANIPSEDRDKQFNSSYSNDLVYQIYATVIGKLIILNYDRKNLFKIIIRFFKFSKEKNILGKYMENRQIPNIISITLCAIIEFQGSQQMLFFLRESVRFLRFTENVSTTSFMVQNYQCFFSIADYKPQLISAVLDYWKRQRMSECYAAAIYYSLDQAKLLTHLPIICKLIQAMPSKIIAYFQVLIYKNIVLHKKCFSARFINQGLRPNQQRNKRKITKIQNRLIKLLSVHHSDHSDLALLKNKSHKLRHIKLQFLQNACKKIGSFELQEKQKRITLKLL